MEHLDELVLMIKKKVKDIGIIMLYIINVINDFINI